MPLAPAAPDVPAIRRVTAAAIAAALQCAFYWLILHEAVAPATLPTSAPLEVTILQAAARLMPAPFVHNRRPGLAGWQTPPLREVPPPAARTQSMTLPRAAEPGPRPPIDWRQAMQGEVRAQEALARARKLRFGFPQRPAPPPRAAPAFGWDYAHTHRLEALPRGGMVINLSDHCKLVIYGLMFFPACTAGKIPVEGQLFGHMHERRNEDLDALP